MRLLHVDASARSDRSNSRALSRRFVEALRERILELSITHLDLAKDPPSHPSELYTRAVYTAPEERTSAMADCLKESDGYCRLVLEADTLVFALPMYNFCYPSTFKAFIDNIIRYGVTYEPQPDGTYDGKLAGKRVLFITSRGGDLRPGAALAHLDALTPALKAAFGFIGVSDPHFVDAQPLQFADQRARERALARAEAELDALALDWAVNASSRAR